jgi:hypothetical protein
MFTCGLFLSVIMQSVFSVAARRRDAFGSEWIVMAAPVR